jgi:adenylyl-sulfate kinase
MSKTIWLTGLSGAGKSTIAEALKKKYFPDTVIIDGDALRKTINKELGYTEEDRQRNITRAAEICKLINDQGHYCIATMMSPLESQRMMAKHIIGEENFFLVYVSCDIDTLKQRDTKGLYKQFQDGEIKFMVGLDLPFDVPVNPNVVVNTNAMDLHTCIQSIVSSFGNKIIDEYVADTHTI